MTTLPDVTGEQVAAQYADVGRHISRAIRLLLFVVGWLLAKTCRLVATTIGLLLFAVGFAAGRVVRPVLLWSAAAVRLGWQEGIRPPGEPRTEPV